MSIFKKSVTVLLFSVLIFTAVFTASACEKIEAVSEIFVVSEETYNASVKNNGDTLKFSPEKVREASEENVIEGGKYYALIYLGGVKLVNGRIELSDGVTATEIKTSSSGKGADISAQREYGEGNVYKVSNSGKNKKMNFYAAISFTVDAFDTVSNSNAEVVNIKIEFSSEMESEWYENSVNATKEILYNKQINTTSSIKFLTENDYKSEEFDDKLKTIIEIGEGEKCYAVIDYTLSTKNAIEETDVVTVKISAASADGAVFKLGIEDIPTPDYTEENGEINASFKIHGSGEDGKLFRFITVITAEKAGNMEIFAEISGYRISFIGNRKLSGNASISTEPTVPSKLGFELSSDGSYYILTGFGEETGDIITVPSRYNGLKVKEVADNVFQNTRHITGIKLSSGVEKIGSSAFKACTAVKSIVIPSSVTSIGKDAFAQCPGMDIFCEIEEKPAGWSDAWVSENMFVTWDYHNRFALNSDGETYTFSYKGLNGINVTVPSTYNGLPVVNIGEHSFSACTDLKRLKIPSTVKSIDDDAFVYIEQLSEVHITDLNTWLGLSLDRDSNPLLTKATLYLNGEPLTKLSIPEGITEIKDYTFYNCASITEIVFPESLKTIGIGAFWGCSSLESLNIPETVENIGVSAFKECTGLKSITVHGGITSIPNSVFLGCTGLTELTIGSGVTEIGNYAFNGCQSLIEIELPSTLERIGDYSFENCSGLISVNIPSSVTYIGDAAFRSCSKVTGFTFASGTVLSSIGSYAFEGCVLLTSITFPKSVESIGTAVIRGCHGLTNVAVESGNSKYKASGNCLIEGTKLIAGCNSSQLPTTGINSIADYAFYGCTGLTTVTIPNGVGSIGKSAFADCTGITNLTIGGGVGVIGDYAFSRCKSIKTVTIPSLVSKIGRNAFEGCNSLTEFKFSDTSTWYATSHSTYLNGVKQSVSDTSANATTFSSGYYNTYWYKQ